MPGAWLCTREHAEAQLRQIEERHRLIFDHNPLPIWLYNCETLRFLAVNDAAVQHYGYTREEFLSMTIRDIHPVKDIPELLTTIERVWGTVRCRRECRHQRKDGSVIQVDIVSSDFTSDGCVARLEIASDITDKRLLEEKVLHAQRIESIGMLAAGIAHDLNNVLAPIMFAAPLLRGSVVTERDQDILDTLEKSAVRGAGLVKQILGFARNTAGDFQQTQVKHLVRDIVSIMEETFPKSIRIEHHIAPDLWSVYGNATQIHQVLINLCVNARDAMPQGGILRLSAANRIIAAEEARHIPGASAGDWISLEVADTGTGISPEMMDRVWTPFVTTKGEGLGTGLGLPTVKGIVASHHGFVELQTRVGHGSTFRVSLPAIEREPAHSGRCPPNAIPRGNGEIVLLVDDDIAIRKTAAAVIEIHGYRVIPCKDGAEALATFEARSREIDLVVTDVDMPRLGGLALIRALLQLRPELRLIAMSGLTRVDPLDSHIAEVRTMVQEVLQKPFMSENLLLAIHRVLQHES